MINDKIRGSIFGGAVGDALGYAIEFEDEKTIFSQYGKDGIQEYKLETSNKKAIISDDTQMTLFTACAMIFRADRQKINDVSLNPSSYAYLTYQDWLITQEMSYQKAVETVFARHNEYKSAFISEPLKNVPELFNRRAPGITCLSALHTRKEQREKHKNSLDFINDKINNSKGCGGVMRVAPVGMMKWCDDVERVAMEGAQCAAITHCHSLGYMSAAVLVQMIYQIIYNDHSLTLKEITIEARDTAAKLFEGDKHLDELINCINDAIEFSKNSDSDLNNIHRLGEGWVAEEALAIAIYCSLKYKDKFSKGVIAAVNHKGDSDSTGAITGNILGALVGYEAIEQKWKENLEISDTILRVADLIYERSI